MVSASLKQATRTSHAELEKLMITRIRNTHTLPDYLRLLEIFYGFFKPVEEKIDAHIDRGYLTDYASRRKSAAIMTDMTKLQPTVAERLCDNLPQITNTTESLGAMYVLEGSTLGGRIICKLLADNMGAQSPASFSFFGGYGDSTEGMWMQFKEKLDNYTDDEKQHKQMIKAANETFVKFKEWILQHD
jgi:heme oxygenase